jgi:hypothetical protein
MRISVLVTSITLIFGSNVLADDTHYYPPVSGPPAGFVVGRLTDIGFGNGSGGLTLRTASGQTLNFYAARPPFFIDGSIVECPQPPMRGFVPSHVDCPHWPSNVIVGRSEVRVSFWRGQRYGKPTLITDGFTTVGRLRGAGYRS